MNARPSRWSRWRSLDPEQRRVLWTASALLPLVWLALWTLRLPRLQALVSRSQADARAADPERARRLGRAVNIAASRSPFPVTCLTRSLLLGWMLGRRGLASNLRIGVRLKEGVFSAHAWVECNGAPVNDRADVAADFAPFDDLGPLASFDR